MTEDQEKSRDSQEVEKLNDMNLSQYRQLFEEIKTKIQSARIKAALAVNKELIQLYWEIGSFISKRQQQDGWGSQFVDRIARDLKRTFPDSKGFSKRNLFYMRKFANAYEDPIIVQQVAAQIPWGHTLLLLDRIEDNEERLWYTKKVIENGWSRNVLLHWMDSNLYSRQGKAITNFKNTLPSPQSDLANQTLKDPYNFDFLALREKFDEKELESGLLDHIQSFLLELGQGFAFVGRQYPITVEGETSYIDLLFYHVNLRCFIVVELKARPFSPKDVGQINYYLSAVDDMMRASQDNPSIGLLLCKGKNGLRVEYALRDFNKPIGVAGYETQIIESLPEDLKGSLPTIEELEQELDGDE